MPAVPNNYAGWTVESAKSDLEAVGLGLGSVPDARSRTTHPIDNGENGRQIEENADWCEQGAQVPAGSMVGVVLKPVLEPVAR